MANSKYAKYWEKKEQEKNSASSEQKKTANKYDAYWARKFSEKQLPTLIEDYNNSYNNLYSSYNSRFGETSERNKYRADTQDALTSYTSQKDELNTKANSILSSLTQYGDYLDADSTAKLKLYLEDVNKNLDTMYGAYKSDYDYYSQWENEESYNNWLSAENAKKEQLTLDIPTAQKEIEEMQERLSFLDNQIKGMKANEKMSNIAVAAPGQVQLYDPYAAQSQINNSEMLSKYQAEYEELSEELANKKQYLITAERLQLNVKLVDNAKNSADFEQISAEGLALLENSQNNDNLSDEKLRDWGMVVSGNASSVRDAHLMDSLFSTTGVNQTKDTKAKFDALTEDEKKVYAYYLGKNDAESAKAYLKNMEDTLNQRVATGIYEEQYKDNTALEMFYGVKAGLNQNLEGMIGFANQVTGNEEYRAPSGTDYVSAMIRDDLGEESAIHQGAYDLITTTSNMLPSILTSTLIGTVAPGVGQVVGAGMMGISASGSAYQEMINLGYNKEQARTYGTLVGASETALGTVLGGISKLGGAVGTKALPKALATKFASAADTAIGNLAIRYGSSMLSEFSEEALQEILDPVFQNIAVGYDLNDLSEIELSDILYSGLLGALSAGLFEGGSIVTDTVNTSKFGSSVKKSDNVEQLKELGKTVSVDSAAYRIAGKVNEKSSAYTIGKLFKEVGATLNEGNISNLKSNLISRGMSETDAQVLAEAYAYGVVDDTLTLTPEQEEVFKNNEVLATAAHEELIGKNKTYNQQVERYFQIANDVESKKIAKPVEKSTETATQTVDGTTANTFEGATENTVENDFKQTTYNGEAVSFKYKSHDTVQLDNGETVSVEDITMSDDDALFYDAVIGENDIFPEARFVNGELTSGVDITTANEIRKIFGGTPTAAQLKGVEMYYRYGMYNIKRFGESGALTEVQEKQVFNLGRAFGEYLAETESKTPKVKKYSKGKVKYNIKSKLNSRQQASVEVVEKLADMFNITFNLYESTLNENGERLSVMPNGEQTTANGYYMNGEIYIDINAGNKGQGAMLYTVAHELTHYIKEWSPKKFKILANFLVEQYESKGKSVDYYVNKQMEKARKSGNKNMKYSEAFEEFVADSMEKMLTDKNAVEKLVALRTKDKSIFDKLREGVKKLVDKVKQEYDKLRPDSAEGRIVENMTDVFGDIQDLFLEALDDASTNYQNAEKNTATNDGAKMQLREMGLEEFSKETINNIKMRKGIFIETMSDLEFHIEQALTTNQKLNMFFGAISDEVKSKIEKDLNINIFKEKQYAFVISYDDIVHIAEHFGTNASIIAEEILKLYDIVKNYDNVSLDTTDRGTKKLIFNKNYSNADYRSVEIVSNKKATLDLVTFFITKNNIKKGTQSVPPATKSSLQRGSNSSNNSIPQDTTTVNNNSMQKKAKNSLRDTEYFNAIKSKDLSKAQELVEDAAKKAGYTIKSYHGTLAKDFTEFKKDLIGSRFSFDEKGFFFIDRKSIAEDYATSEFDAKNKGRVLEVYLKSKNPLIVDSNFAIKNGLGRIYRDNDVIDVWDNYCTYLLEEAENYRADAIILNDGMSKMTVVFEPEQIKSADAVVYDDVGNIIPLSRRFDKRQKDIRFSERGQSVYELLGENKRLQKENRILSETVEYLEKLVQMQGPISASKIINGESVKIIARDLKKNTGSKINLSNLENQLNSFYSYILSSDEHEWNDIFTRASWIAIDILNEVPESTQRDEYAQEILSYLRATNITLNNIQRAEVENIYDSYNAYRKHLMGSITISQKGTSLDSVWQDLAEQYPDTFSKDTNPADMPLELADIIHTLRNSYEIIAEFDSVEQTRSLAERIYNTYWDLSVAETAINQLPLEYRLKVKELRNQHANLMKEIVDRYENKLTDQKAYYQEMYKRLRERATASHKKQMLDYQDKVHEAQARAIEKRNNTVTRNQILKTLDKIDARLTHPTKEKNIGLEMQPLACRLLMLANLDTVDADYRIDRIHTEMENTRNPQVLNTLQTRIENITAQGEKKAAELQRKRNKYKAIAADAQKSLQEMGKEVSVDEVISKTLEDIETLVGSTPIRRMTSYQLECFKNAVNMVDGYIRADKQLFIDGKKQNVELTANAVMREVLGNSQRKREISKLRDLLEKWGWTNLKPETAFDLIGSDSLSKLFQEARKGDDKFARSVSDAQAFLSENVKKYGADKWDMEEHKDFNIQGEKVTLTLGEILSLYAYSKREQAIPHLESGGFVQIEPVKKKIVGKINVEYTVYEDHAHRISKIELGSIINALTKEQVAFADVLQEYLSTVMGAKGNEISRELYQIDLFKEKFYFPLKLHSTYKFFQTKENTGTAKLKNVGMTKPVVINANDPIVLESFENVWANHVVQMSRYNAYVLGIENLDRVFGYRGLDKSSSLRAALEGAFGESANDYIEYFIADLNGGRKGSKYKDMVNFASKLVSTFKKVTVSASLSTAIQQPSSVIRAMAMVKPKYFLMKKDEKISHKDNWAELKKYAPIATLKEIGGYDMSSGVNVVDFIKQRDYKGKEKFIALVKDSRYRDEFLMWGASKADEMAWSALWNAVKKEQRHRFPKMEKEKFLKICGERFTAVATKTQVYDSVFTRSEIMRSPSETNKMATSFMGEPMTNLNIIIDSVIQAKRGKISRKQAAWNISCVYVAQIAAAALASVVYAMRDDDDDESFYEKYMAAFGSKVKDEMLTITWVPYVRDVFSLIEGYDVTRTDMSVFSDLVKSFKNLDSKSMSTWDKISGVAGSVAAAFGLPLKNLLRDGNAIVNTVQMVFDDNVAQKGDGGKAFAEGIFGEKKMAEANEYLEKGKTDKANKLIADLLEEKTEKYISNGKTPEKAEKDAKSAIRSSLTSYWKPLFIEAYQEDDYIEQEEIYEKLNSTGIYGTAEELKETIEKWVKDLQ